MKSKPVEEIERINKAKLFGDHRGFSRISQKLFEGVVARLGNKYKKIYYATVNPERTDGEYMVYDEQNRSTYFLDFYVEDNNKVIEFDGDYWHGEKRGNQQRDAEREANLRQLGYTDILRIRERDYNADPDAVVRRCVEFITGKDS